MYYLRVGRVQFIGRHHPLYPQEVELRERVLLSPVGLDLAGFQRLFPGVEERLEHFVTVIEHPTGRRVIGCVCLLPHFPGTGVGKLMQMAVDPQRQREGIGRELVAELERRAFGELSLSELFCHARNDAIPFYERMGWTIDGPQFIEAGIPHHRMVFRPPAQDPQ